MNEDLSNNWSWDRRRHVGPTCVPHDRTRSIGIRFLVIARRARGAAGPLVPPVGGTKLYAFIQRWRKKWYFLHFWRIWMFSLRIWTHALVSLSYFTNPTCICTPLIQIIVNCIHECVGGSTSYHLNNIYMVTQVKQNGRPSYTTVESMLTCKFTLLWMEA